ncbi:fibulin-2 isoform X2 [Cricetulus griseus]|uniref:Fibulin-2 n=1 Tax=Cricetulus griseus TaxID=10029 RepID=A0A9J7H6T5_CRIGR|nr:fibulin-2 isoform X2 [Cricetulus griseus]XP_035304753.1 fibulin-2 isoform X2 [Cricetulus griseus]
MMLLQESAGAWLALALITALTVSPGTAVPWQDCTGAECPPLENCIEEALEPGACCATCVQQGCACEGYQYYDCVQGGFVDGRVPAGQSYFVDFGSTECSCPPGGGKISCQFMLCPELPPNCIEAVVVADSCPQCGQVGCVHNGHKYAAGHTFHLSPCRACHCPDAGGELICYQLPGCHGNFSDAEEGDSERQYEDPYSYDQEVAEAETTMATVNEVQAGAEGPPAALGGGNLPPSSIRATPWPAALPRPTAAAALGPPASMQAKARRVTQEIDEEEEEEDEEEEEMEEMVVTEPPVAGDLGRLDSLPTTPPARPNLPVQEKEAEARAGPEENLIPDAQATPPSAGQEGAAPLSRSGPAGFIPSLATDSSPADPVKSSSHSTQSTLPPDRAQVSPSPEVPKEIPQRPQLRSQSRAEEDTDPNSVHSVPRGGPDVSTKDLIETCCAAGQQWAIDNDECQEIPQNGAESDVCRIAQRHCCVSYLKEKSCMAGVMGAKEGEACGAEDNDTCGISLYKQCCDCCGLGLRVRAEGQSCESNPNLGYPCNHVMLSCCEGEEPLIVPEVRRPPEPEATPRRVSEAEMANREALSLGTEAELPNSLPGDDQDECLLLPGELCQHLCINTVGSYRCACFPGFELQGDGRTCRPDGGAPQLDTARESAPRSESAQVSPNTIPLPVPQPNTCKDNGPCRQVCRVVGGTAMCSCFPGYAIMADGVSCEDINECVTDLHTCTRDEHCVNTPGSFQCYKTLTCEPGYALTDGECTDVDECVTGTHNCQSGFSCQNTKGSFYCQARQRCMDGFLQDPEGNCVDINECTSLLEPCRSGFSCINTVGSYTCQRNPLVCRRGYHANEDGSECVDVNECETGVHRCGEGQLCHNLPGSYRCDCKPGFQRDAFGRTCIDVNECWVSPGRLCQHTCENTPGSYRCSCAAGFILAADGKHCEDVNECEARRCSQECANIYGSYQCYCRQGYQLAEDGHSCTDIDECAQGAGILCTFRCVNVPGSYQCACPEQGYTMMANGRSCKDLDECALGTHNCSEAETCHNIQGSFRCLRFECPPNYVRVSETKCERTTCQDITECQTSPARITHYQLNFQTGLLVPAHIFRIGPAPAFAGDTISLTITKGNEEGYFVTSRLNAYTGVVSLQRSVLEPRDFALDVEMKLWRQGSVTTFLAKMYIFFTTFAP